MKTGSINLNNSVNFKSHLTPQIMRAIRKTDVAAVEDTFKGNYCIDLNCQSNKFFAFCFARTLNIFEELSERFNLPFQALPPQIRVYANKETVDKKFFTRNMCLLDLSPVFKKEPLYELRSILAENKSATKVNNEVNVTYRAHMQSSSHFLSDVIHEWMHNIHFDLIYKKYGYSGRSLLGKKLYPSQKPTGKKVMKRYDQYRPDELKRRPIYETLGAYSTRSHSKLEIFAESFTKVITEALDKNLNVTRNPLDGIVTFPQILKKFIESQLA